MKTLNYFVTVIVLVLICGCSKEVKTKSDIAFAHTTNEIVGLLGYKLGGDITLIRTNRNITCNEDTDGRLSVTDYSDTNQPFRMITILADDHDKIYSIMVMVDEFDAWDIKRALIKKYHVETGNKKDINIQNGQRSISLCGGMLNYIDESLAAPIWREAEKERLKKATPDNL